MVSRIILPRSISEEIRYKGKKEGAKNKEALGVIFGTYNSENDSILISENLDLMTKIGDDTLKARLYDNLKLLFGYPRMLYVAFKLASHKRKLSKTGKTMGLVGYHSHDQGSWSDDDLSPGSQLSGVVPTAEILYRVDTDEFEAIDNERRPIKIEIV